MDQQPPLSDVDRRIIIELFDRINAIFMRFQEAMVQEHAATMKEYGNLKPAEPGPFEKHNGPILKWAMPQEVYSWLKQVQPDGCTDFTQNMDFMSWLKKTYPWFAQFELADKNWQDVAPGHSTMSGPKSQEERRRIAQENAVIMNDRGEVVKASEAVEETAGVPS